MLWVRHRSACMLWLLSSIFIQIINCVHMGDACLCFRVCRERRMKCASQCTVFVSNKTDLSGTRPWIRQSHLSEFVNVLRTDGSVVLPAWEPVTLKAFAANSAQCPKAWRKLPGDTSSRGISQRRRGGFGTLSVIYSFTAVMSWPMLWRAFFCVSSGVQTWETVHKAILKDWVGGVQPKLSLLISSHVVMTISTAVIAVVSFSHRLWRVYTSVVVEA